VNGGQAGEVGYRQLLARAGAPSFVQDEPRTCLPRKASDLPVEQATNLLLTINLKNAK
jgi:hypothetical protein